MDFPLQIHSVPSNVNSYHEGPEHPARYLWAFSLENRVWPIPTPCSIAEKRGRRIHSCHEEAREAAVQELGR